ncbi:hypothetical protein CXF68_02685 [Tenacibaculum sp. Bg11-29]|uniref:hypothetical protein n=1 Tax=Tenacibaculum sp. Bg11-29 TaxID=2058306 RepID=UPI000C34E946|nr:hypothetical protein [Tenacibaculum sp. Bg11-29]PKH49664.1 hypothetical protein CXF68_02685 [Tenacibaculum sp. Bg11-29]
MKLKGSVLFSKIKKSLPKNVLFVEEISDVLDISSDAAYRRIKGKTLLTFEEGIELAKFYNISLNELYELKSDNFLMVRNNSYESTVNSLVQFYKDFSSYTKTFFKYKDVTVIYSAKDIPLYHFSTDSLYWKFRIYVLFNFLYKDDKDRVSFKDFKLKTSLVEVVDEFKSNFKKTNIIDLWEDTTINSSLYQVFYFFKTKLIQKEEAIQLCEDILNVVNEIEKSTANSYFNTENKGGFELYYSKLLNLNHTIFYKTKGRKALLVPYGSLSHMKIEDETVCNDVDLFLKRQLKFSEKISGDTNEVNRKLFFTSMYEKIKELKVEIKSRTMMSFK